MMYDVANVVTGLRPVCPESARWQFVRARLRPEFFFDCPAPIRRTVRLN